MPISRWLIVAFFVGQQVFDRVLDGEDVDVLALVHIVQHRGDGRGLAGAGDTREQHDALGLHRHLGHDRRQVEFLEPADGACDEAAGAGHLAAGLEDVHAEAVLLVVVVGEVGRPVLAHVLPLLLAQDVPGDLHKLLRGDRLGVQRLQGAADAEFGGLAGLADQVRSLQLDARLQERAEPRRVRVVLLVRVQGGVARARWFRRRLMGHRRRSVAAPAAPGPKNLGVYRGGDGVVAVSEH